MSRQHSLTGAIPMAHDREGEFRLPMPPQTATPFSPIPAGWHALHHTILADGTLAVVVTDVDLASEWVRIHASRDGRLDPHCHIDRLTKSGLAKLLIRGEEGSREGPVFPLETPHPLRGRFADGRWLVVSSRTRDEPNARILSPDGTLLTQFMLGDGIEHVAIDDMDRIWSVGSMKEYSAGDGACPGWSGHRPPMASPVLRRTAKSWMCRHGPRKQGSSPTAMR